MAVVSLPFTLRIKALVPQYELGRNTWTGAGSVPPVVADAHFPWAWITRGASSRTLPNLVAWREKKSPLGLHTFCLY